MFGNTVTGKLKGIPRASAGNIGTQITVEDLFYNVPTRQRAFKNHAEEYQKIANVVTKYAIHNSGISFTLRKADNESGQMATVSLRTQEGATVKNNITSVYGASVGRELLDVCEEDNDLKLKIKGWVSNANSSMKKFNFLLFINNRLVECSSLKRALESVYQTYLPKGKHPFVYLSIEMSPINLDVNVHPTKHEVRFLNEEEVVESVQRAVETRLLSCDSSTTFYTQKLLPTSVNTSVEEKSNKRDQQQAKLYDHQLVRTDSKLQKLDAFFNQSSEKKPQDQGRSSASSKRNNKTVADLPRRRRIRLTSVIQLQDDVREACSEDLLTLLRDHTFVGVVDAEFALLQHSTKLYLCNSTKLSQEFFYQVLLMDFGNFGMFRLSEPASIRGLAMLGLDSEESGWEPADGDKSDLADYLVKFYSEKSEMLKDYFCLDIKDGDIIGFPLLLGKYSPPVEGLPMLVLRMATEVNWESEKECFDSICRELSRFYSIRKGYTDFDDVIREYESHVSMKTTEAMDSDSVNNAMKNDDIVTSTSGNDDASKPSWKWTLEHVIYRAMRHHFLPPDKMKEDGSILQLANLPDLYKVFERC